MPTWTEILDFPADICITDVSFTPEYAMAVRENEFNYKQEVQVFSGERITLQVSFRRHDPESAGRLESFLLKLRGSAGVFRFGDPYHSQPLGRAVGLPEVETAQAGSQTFTTTGWTPNVQAQLKQGDYIQIGDRLYRTLDDVHSDSSGAAEIKVFPSLRETYSVETPLILRNATGLFRLSNTPSFSRTPIGQKHSADTIDLKEAL